MQSKCTTKIEINKVRISFTRKKITAYGPLCQYSRDTSPMIN